MKDSTVLDIGTLELGQDDSCRAFLFFIPDKAHHPRFKCVHSMDVIDYIRNGFPYTTVHQILNTTCVSRKELSNILHLSLRQMNRYSIEDVLPAEQSGFVYELGRLYVRGLDTFGDKETFESWLLRAQPALGMKSPMSLLDTTEGFRMVNDLLSRIEYGFYS